MAALPEVGIVNVKAPLMSLGVPPTGFQLAVAPKASLDSSTNPVAVSGHASTRLLADKLPFTPDRISPGPLAVRIISGAACGAAISYSAKKPVQEGAIFGALGALVATFAGYHLRRKLSRKTSSLGVALAEDALAIGAGFAIVAQLSE